MGSPIFAWYTLFMADITPTEVLIGGVPELGMGLVLGATGSFGLLSGVPALIRGENAAGTTLYLLASAGALYSGVRLYQQGKEKEVAAGHALENPDYGVATLHPQSGVLSLTSTGTGLPNEPTSAQHIANMELLKDFIAKVPFQVSINSGFRTRAVNTAVGGAGASQHMNGLALDINPVDSELGAKFPGGANRALAAWFYQHRAEFPELDQVIWYMDKGHTHVGICPPGATGCISGAPRQQFKVHFSHGYQNWRPDPGEAIRWAKKHPVQVGLLTGALLITGSLALGAIAITAAWALTRKK